MSVANPDSDYYHVNRRVAWSAHPPLQVGQQLEIGGASNPYFAFFETQRRAYPVTQADGSQVLVPGVHFVASVARGEIQSTVLANIAHELVQHFVVYVRELVWEDLRRREFPHLPSRQRCIWLIPSLAGAKYWAGRLRLTGEDQVVRLKVQGRVHRASESFLLGDSEPLEETIRKARLYWLGVIDDPEKEEIIFEGRAKVVEVVSPSLYS